MILKKIGVVFTAFTLTMASCGEAEPVKFSKKVEKAHNNEAFKSNEAIAFDILLSFGGNVRLDGKMTLLTGSGSGLIEEKNGSKLYFVDDKIYYDSSKTNLDKARFSAYTWSYFFLLPYKLNDDGTKWQDYADKKLNGGTYLTEKLTFESGTGDAPDDWYVVYADEETKLLHAAAYIVTANRTVEEAEEDPHAIKYENYKTINNVPVATKWTFWGWQPDQGLTEQLGEADLSNIEFKSLEDNFFTPPAHYMEN